MQEGTITAQLVKALREETGLPLMVCKQALKEAKGDYEVARRLLLRPPGAPDEPEPAPVE